MLNTLLSATVPLYLVFIPIPHSSGQSTVDILVRKVSVYGIVV